MYCLYEIATGRLDSTTDNLALMANPLPAGFAYVEVVDPPDGYIWNTSLLDFVSPPLPRVIGKTAFIDRFTTAEKKELFGFSYGTTYNAAQQKNLASIMRYLDFLDKVNLDSPDIQNGVNYFATVNILTAQRVTEVLA